MGVKRFVFISLLLLIPVFASFGVAPASHELQVNPAVATKYDATVRVYWSSEFPTGARVTLKAVDNTTEDWAFITPEELYLEPPENPQDPTRKLVYVYLEIPEDAPEGKYPFHIKVSLDPLEGEGQMKIVQESASALNVVVNRSYTPTETGWREPEGVDSGGLNLPLVAGATVLILVALVVFMKL